MNPEQQRIFDALAMELVPYGFQVRYNLVYGTTDRVIRVTIEGHGVVAKEVLILPSGQIL